MIGVSMAVHAQTVGHDLGKDAAVLRLIAAPTSKSDVFSAGVEIAMTPGSHTYWKMPGEAGVPPVFSFNGSENIASADVAFPVPKRITEDGLDAFGYTDRVTFPVKVRLKDATKPAVLKADVTFAVCNKICLPAHGVAEVSLPGGATGDSQTILADAQTDVPLPMSPGDLTKLAVEPVAGKDKPTWNVTWTGAPVSDLFANAPEGFYFDTNKTGAGTWTLVAAQSVASSQPTKVPVELTLARPVGGLVTTVPLDLKAKAK